MDAKTTSSARTTQSGHDDSLIELRDLLLGDELVGLEEIRARLDDPRVRSQETSMILADALLLSAKRDKKLHQALQPMIEESLRASVERDPHLLASTLFPIVGQAVRKSVAHALQHMVDSLNSILSEGFSLRRWRWRLEAMRTGKSFGEVALTRSLTYAVEHLYLIHRETGLLLAENGNTLAHVEDADLVVGMLTALQDFVRDSFTKEKEDNLEILNIGEFKVWIFHGPLAILAAIVRGTLPEVVHEQLSTRVENIHANYHAQLLSFATSGQPIVGMRDQLSDCLVRTVASDAASYTRFNIAASILFSCTLAILFVHVRDAMRWRQYIEALRREPGVVIVDDHYGWSSFTLTGLRDPMALQPQSLLANFHLHPDKVSEQWMEYLSLDPRLACKRRLLDEANRLSNESVRFNLDSTTLPIDQLARVGTLSHQIEQLRVDATSQGRTLKIRIFGHTDSSGAEERNAKLSQARAETMMSLLIEHGVDGSILSTEGVGDKQPQRPGADLYEQSLDRRVTFSVSLMPIGHTL